MGSGIVSEWRPRARVSRERGVSVMLSLSLFWVPKDLSLGGWYPWVSGRKGHSGPQSLGCQQRDLQEP